MATTQDYNRTTLDDFPEYECYYLMDIDGAFGLGKQHIRKTPLTFRYYAKYGMYRWMNSYHRLLKRSDIPYVVCGTSEVKESDTLIIHPECIVPRSIVSVGKVLNEKSPETPTKVVVPYNYVGNLTGCDCVLMVNHDAKIVFMVVTDCADGDIRGTEQEWKNALLLSQELCNDFGQEVLNGFEMPYGTSVFFLGAFCDLDIALLQGRIPPEMVVCENKLVTGTKELDADTLYSCYKMLDSTDNQIVESACNILARNRFNNVDALVGWIIRSYKSKIRYYRNKSTAFFWVYCSCLNKYAITGKEMKDTAKKIICRITNDEVHWDGSTMVVSKARWFDNPDIRNLVDCINKS